MHRKTRGEKTERFSSTKEYPELEVLRRKLARWVADKFENIRDAVPQNIPDIENRNLDNYEPLFKIAHVVGGQWPSLIHDAALQILGGVSPVQESRSLELLKDIKSIFDEDDIDRIASADLVQALADKEERPWREYNKGNRITQNQMSRVLKDFMIYSRKIRIGEKTLQGYFVSQFEDAFSRYIPQDPPFTESEPEHRNTDKENNDLGQKTQPEHSGSVPVGKNGLSTEKNKRCSGVPVENSETDEIDMTSPNENASLDMFSGARILRPEEVQAITAEDADRQAIRAERSRWQQDHQGAWREVEAPKPADACDHCDRKLIEARWPDGNVTVQCHGCGREKKCIRENVENKRRLTRVKN